MIVKIPIMVPFRYPLLMDWLWIYLRHYGYSQSTVFVDRLRCMIVVEIPDLPEQLQESLEEVGCELYDAPET